MSWKVYCMGGVGRFGVRAQALRRYLNLELAIVHAKLMLLVRVVVSWQNYPSICSKRTMSHVY